MYIVSYTYPMYPDCRSVFHYLDIINYHHYSWDLIQEYVLLMYDFHKFCTQTLINLYIQICWHTKWMKVYIRKLNFVVWDPESRNFLGLWKCHSIKLSNSVMELKSEIKNKNKLVFTVLTVFPSQLQSPCVSSSIEIYTKSYIRVW